MRDAVVAVDVGTGSARAAVLRTDGAMLAKCSHPIAMNNPAAHHAEHSSTDIWHAVCAAVRGAVAGSGIEPERIAALSFDATCSLVVLDHTGDPVSVSVDGDAAWDTVVWLDHRAVDEAQECTATGHRVLRFIGGVMSPEMQIPKIMWLKRNLPGRWPKIGMLLDLADFLTYRASGNLARSACTLTCKWTYLGHEDPAWQPDFLAMVGLSDLLERGQLPGRATALGDAAGPLNASAAQELGLTTACQVGIGAIDAHAGAIGVLGGTIAKGGSLDRHIGLIAGTSTCHMALSGQPREISGIWGPYLDAALPGHWLNEGGQSATGALLDHVLKIHGEGCALGGDAHQAVIDAILSRGPDWCHQIWRLHVLPDFHGNRSPLADPHALGVISGLDMTQGIESLCQLYYRTAVGIVLGTRHILAAMNEQGYAIDTLNITGGHTKNPVLMRLYADLTQCRVVMAQEEDAVLLGTGILAAAAAGLYPDLQTAASAMAHDGAVIEPEADLAVAAARDYRVFLAMHDQRRALDRIVS